MSTRVHELAKELGLKSQELLERIQKWGLDVKVSALASLDPSTVERIRELVKQPAAGNEARSAAAAAPPRPLLTPSAPPVKPTPRPVASVSSPSPAPRLPRRRADPAGPPAPAPARARPRAAGASAQPRPVAAPVQTQTQLRRRPSRPLLPLPPAAPPAPRRRRDRLGPSPPRRLRCRPARSRLAPLPWPVPAAASPALVPADPSRRTPLTAEPGPDPAAGARLGSPGGIPLVPAPGPASVHAPGQEAPRATTSFQPLKRSDYMSSAGIRPPIQRGAAAPPQSAGPARRPARSPCPKERGASSASGPRRPLPPVAAPQAPTPRPSSARPAGRPCRRGKDPAAREADDQGRAAEPHAFGTARRPPGAGSRTRRPEGRPAPAADARPAVPRPRRGTRRNARSTGTPHAHRPRAAPRPVPPRPRRASSPRRMRSARPRAASARPPTAPAAAHAATSAPPSAASPPRSPRPPCSTKTRKFGGSGPAQARPQGGRPAHRRGPDPEEPGRDRAPRHHPQPLRVHRHQGQRAAPQAHGAWARWPRSTPPSTTTWPPCWPWSSASNWRSSTSEPPRTNCWTPSSPPPRRRTSCPGRRSSPSSATSTTARPRCWTGSASRRSSRARAAASPSTSAPTRWSTTASRSRSSTPPATRPSPPCAPAGPT